MLWELIAVTIDTKLSWLPVYEVMRSLKSLQEAALF
jgi:hypothetical protein